MKRSLILGLIALLLAPALSQAATQKPNTEEVIVTTTLEPVR